MLDPQKGQLGFSLKVNPSRSHPLQLPSWLQIHTGVFSSGMGALLNGFKRALSFCPAFINTMLNKSRKAQYRLGFFFFVL
jgi:hypothetical protein